MLIEVRVRKLERERGLNLLTEMMSFICSTTRSPFSGLPSTRSWHALTQLRRQYSLWITCEDEAGVQELLTKRLSPLF